MAKELFNGTNSYNCKTCIHGMTYNCEDVWDESRCCEYWYHPESKIQGLAYEYQTFEEKMPLFA